ncbi:hypothetical protein CKQ79_28695, partial [Klebsiella pneumoniae]
LIVTCILYVGTDISQEYTQAAVNSHIPVPEGMACGAVYHSARQPRTALCRSGFLNVPAGNGHAVL